MGYLGAPVSTLSPPLRDLLGRALRDLRLSVTDRCNLRCHYCMPEREYVWLPKHDRLSFEELARLVRLLVPLGVRALRLTGGEPLLRRDVPLLVAQLKAIDGLEEVSMTTNAILLEEQAPALRAAGLDRITVSLDTLLPERFAALAGRDRLAETLRGMQAADRAGFTGTKLNTVLCRGRNDDELVSLLTFAIERGYELRFIEYMDVGGALAWSSEAVVPRDEILERVRAHFGQPAALDTDPSAPARTFALPNGGRFGIIASTTAPFCSTCTRSRLTADGLLFTCLYGTQGLDLRAQLRGGASDEELTASLTRVWTQRRDRGAEERLQDPQRGTSVSKADLRSNPHLEMHTKGG